MDSKVIARWTSGGVVVSWDDRLGDPAHPQWVMIPLFPPALVHEDKWPVIAHGSHRDYANGMDESQAKRWWRVDVRVLQHADGRAIVYAVYDYSTAFSHERDFVARAGLMLDQGTDLVAAIRTVGADLTRATRETGHSLGMHIQAILSGSHVATAVGDCIANLESIAC